MHNTLVIPMTNDNFIIVLFFTVALTNTSCHCRCHESPPPHNDVIVIVREPMQEKFTLTFITPTY